MALLASAMTMFAQNIPYVFEQQNTGAKFKAPEKLALQDLPRVENLPDPFRFQNGKRSTKFKDWEHHRNDIIKYIEYYEIGEMKPFDKLTATLTDPPAPDPNARRGGFGFGFGAPQAPAAGSKYLTVTVTVGDQSIDIHADVTYPQNAGTAPYPALIGISNCLPVNLFTDRGCALINFHFNDICAHQQNRGNEPINKIYPELKDNGAYAFWTWGISRIIDGLQQLGSEVTKIDTRHLAVSGCSWAGKASLFAAAFDERICLAIPQESGGGGVAAWRVSETLGNVERTYNTDGHWFLESMKVDFAKENVAKLPHDHHELAALVCPRALLFFGNTDFEWLADGSAYVSMQAVKEVYRTFGIDDRCAFSISGGHGHCQLPEADYKHVTAYIDRFLLGKEDVNTDFQLAPAFEDVNYRRWIEWWNM